MYFPEDPGGGPPDMEILDEDGKPVTREWFAPTEEPAGERIGFLDVLEEWDALEADLHHHFGIDMCSEVVRKRDWRWFAVRVKWLLQNDTYLYRVLRPPTPTGDTTPHGDT